MRRTRNQVLRELPPRTSEIRRIPATAEQQDLHDGNRKNVSTLLNKKFLNEMDLMRLQKYLLLCRMSADSTTLVDKKNPGYSSKLDELKTLLEQLAAEKHKKILLFSEWTTMLDLIEPILTEQRMPFVRLDGQVPQKKRQALVREFQENPECRLFITTNAGSTGLNPLAGRPEHHQCISGTFLPYHAPYSLLNGRYATRNRHSHTGTELPRSTH